MDQRNLNFWAMEKDVIVYLEENSKVWGSNKLFCENFNLLKTNNNEIEENVKGHTSNDPTLITRQREEIYFDMITLIFKLGKKLSVYAINMEDYALNKKVDLSHSALEEGNETDIWTRCQHIKDLAFGLLANLSDYNVTQAELDKIQKIINDFKEAASSRAIAGGKHKHAVKSFSDLVKEARTILEKMDKMVIGFFDDKKFEDMYFTLRKVHNRRGGHANPLTVESDTPTPSAK